MLYDIQKRINTRFLIFLMSFTILTLDISTMNVTEITKKIGTTHVTEVAKKMHVN